MSKFGNTDDEEEDERIKIEMYGNAKAEDPLMRQRGKCLELNCDVRKYFMELRNCDKRVMRKITFTAETCSQEVADLMMALDKCVKDKAFDALK